MREQNIEVIRKACVAANPYIQSTAHESKGNNLRCKNCGEADSYNNRSTCKNGNIRPIRLADVLLAMQPPIGKHTYAVIASGGFLKLENGEWGEILAQWNLRKDALTDQSDECLTFLANLLK